MQEQGTSATLAPQPSGWRGAVATLRGKSTKSRIVGGSMTMLASSGLVSFLNILYNIPLARMLGPEEFGHAAAAVTLVMLVSAITLSFQLVCAKFVAKNETAGARAAVYKNLHRKAWVVGALLGIGMVLEARWITAYLHLPSIWETILLAVGIAFLIPLGARRGGIQGTCSFTRLATSYVLEAFTKTAGAILLVYLGYGVLGAVVAISGSLVLTYLLVPAPKELRARPQPGLPIHMREGVQAIVFFVGQVVINNVDILLVKHFFPGETAGLYAVVALVGRVLYYVSWMLVSAMFPLTAAARRDEKISTVLAVPILLVLGITLAFMSAMSWFAAPLLQLVFGRDQASFSGFASILTLFVATTGVYCISVVLMAYEMSRKVANTGWWQLLFSGAIVLGIYFFHANVWEVVVVQLVARVLLLIAVTTPFFRSRPRLESPIEEAA
jgi:O-antigen/teichoic acid export membrane protein